MFATFFVFSGLLFGITVYEYYRNMVKGEGNLECLHTKIAEPHPIFYKNNV